MRSGSYRSRAIAAAFCTLRGLGILFCPQTATLSLACSPYPHTLTVASFAKEHVHLLLYYITSTVLRGAYRSRARYFKNFVVDLVTKGCRALLMHPVLWVVQGLFATEHLRLVFSSMLSGAYHSLAVAAAFRTRRGLGILICPQTATLSLACSLHSHALTLLHRSQGSISLVTILYYVHGVTRCA